MGTAQYIRWFSEIRNEDVATVGGKNASLGEMIRQLAPKGVRIPNGFALRTGNPLLPKATANVPCGQSVAADPFED